MSTLDDQPRTDAENRLAQLEQGRAEDAQWLNALENQVAATRMEHTAQGQVLENVTAKLAAAAAAAAVQDGLGVRVAGLEEAGSEIEQKVNALENELAGLRAERAAQHQFLEAARKELAARIDDEVARVLETMLRQRSVVTAPTIAPARTDLTPTRVQATLDDSYQALAREVPEAYEIWRELLEVNAGAYSGFPVHSCSVSGHETAELFACFLRPYLTGSVLDIGCGPQPMPSYLVDHPPELMAGIDPLEPDEPHPFVFVPGVSEFLPWDDATFDLVVVATSLDHVLLLDRAVEEMHRVIVPGGHLAIWVGFVEGAAPYDPRRPDVERVDEYHLFHFDRPWFEELFRSRFSPREVISFSQRGGSWFYCFRRS